MQYNYSTNVTRSKPPSSLPSPCPSPRILLCCRAMQYNYSTNVSPSLPLLRILLCCRAMQYNYSTNVSPFPPSKLLGHYLTVGAVASRTAEELELVDWRLDGQTNAAPVLHWPIVDTKELCKVSFTVSMRRQRSVRSFRHSVSRSSVR